MEINIKINRSLPRIGTPIPLQIGRNLPISVEIYLVHVKLPTGTNRDVRPVDKNKTNKIPVPIQNSPALLIPVDWLRGFIGTDRHVKYFYWYRQSALTEQREFLPFYTNTGVTIHVEDRIDFSIDLCQSFFVGNNLII